MKSFLYFANLKNLNLKIVMNFPYLIITSEDEYNSRIYISNPKFTPLPVSPRGERLRKGLPPWGKVGMGV